MSAVIAEVICKKCRPAPPVPKNATPDSRLQYLQMVDKANLQLINENYL